MGSRLRNLKCTYCDASWETGHSCEGLLRDKKKPLKTTTIALPPQLFALLKEMVRLKLIVSISGFARELLDFGVKTRLKSHEAREELLSMMRLIP